MSSHAASCLAAHEVSVAQLVQRLDDGRAAIELVLHAAPLGAVRAALAEIAALPEVLASPFVVPVISERLIPTDLVSKIGRTPLLEIRLAARGEVSVFAKAEFFNPGGSVKDRPALNMMRDAPRCLGRMLILFSSSATYAMVLRKRSRLLGARSRN